MARGGDRVTVRLETLAHALAKGKTVYAAMLEAGYAETTAKLGLIRDGRGNRISPWDHPEVAARVEEVRAAARHQAEVTTADIARQLDEDRAFAYAEGKPSAAVAATMGKAKVLGLIVDHTWFEGIKPISEMTEPELAAFLKANGMDPDGTLH